MKNPRQTVQRFLDRIDALTLRERALLFIGALVALYLIAANLVFASLLREQSRLDRELTATREQTRTLQAQIEKLVAERGRDPNETNRARLAELRQQLHEREGELAGAMHGVVSPREMASMVEQILQRDRALTVVSVENLPPVPLVENVPAAAGAPQPGTTPAAGGKPAAANGMYKHGLRIQLEGSYPDILRYLGELERLPWKVFWGEVELKTLKYPVSRVTLVLYTLSLDEAWIGV